MKKVRLALPHCPKKLPVSFGGMGRISYLCSQFLKIIDDERA
jgi:hypothetical protein